MGVPILSKKYYQKQIALMTQCIKNQKTKSIFCGRSETRQKIKRFENVLNRTTVFPVSL